MYRSQRFFELRLSRPALIRILYSALAVLLPTQIVTAQTIVPLPTINAERVGSIAGSFEVSESGSATYNIPLAVPPGTLGMVPHLALQYDSQGNSGYVGAGWSISGLSSISRCPKTIARDGVTEGIQLNEDDPLCLDGQRLILESGHYGWNLAKYRTESDTFSRIIQFGSGSGPSGPGMFYAYQKDGMLAMFGSAGPGNGHVSSTVPRTALAWQLTRLQDPNGNAYSVTYQSDPSIGESLPSRIDYTRNDIGGRLAPNNSILFVYEPREFPDSNYVKGYLFGSNKRLAKIQMYAGAVLAWEYRLEYRRDEASREEILTKLTQCSGEGSCLAPTSFTYPESSNHEPTFESQPPLFALSQSNGVAAEGIAPFIIGDWNADGRADIARIYRLNGVSTISAYSSGISPGLSPYATITTQALPSRVIAGDWNADGGTDLAALNDTQLDLYLSNGTGFTNIGSIGPLSSDGINGVISGDWNGDARTDFAVVTGTGVVAYVTTATGVDYFGSLADFSPAQGYTLTCAPEQPDCSPEHDLPIYVGDWNGDGKSDIARLGSGGLKFYVSSADGFTSYSTITAFRGPRDTVRPIVLGDWNGDGLVDVARVDSSSVAVCTSTGAGFGTCTALSALSPAQGFVNDEQNPIVAGDLNGDGTSDLARVRSDGRVIFYLSEDSSFTGPYDTIGEMPPGDHSSLPHDPFPLFIGDWAGDGVAGLGRAGVDRINFVAPNFRETSSITEINNGLGKKTKISYRPLTSPTVYVKGSGAQYPTVDVLTPLPVVKQVEESDGLGGYTRLGYFYEGMRYDLNGRGSQGFAKITGTNFTNGTSSITTYKQEYPLQGVPVLTEVRLNDAAATLVSKQTSTWSVKNFSWGSFYPYISSESEEKYEPNDNSLISRIDKTTTIDDFGNVLQLDVSRSDGSWERTVNTYEIPNEAIWRIGVITDAVVTAGNLNSSTVTRSSHFTYIAGNLWTETLQPSNSTKQVTRAYYPSYNQFGSNTSTTLSAPGMTSRIEYKTFDDRGQFPTEIKNPLNQITQVLYEPLQGKMVRSQDPNGLVTTWTHDVFGREIHEFRPDGTEQRTLILAPDANAPANAAYVKRIDASGTAPQLTYFDALDREILREKVGFDGRSILIDLVYNERGELVNESQPYFRGTTPMWVSHEYDSLGREVRRIEPGTPNTRQTTISHRGLTTTVTNPLGQTSSVTTNIQGKVIRSEDHNHNVLTFVYDGLGQQLSVTDPLGNVTSMTYDELGNRTSITEPNSGTTLTTYDPFGQLISQTNANGQTINYTYDKLGRILTRTRPEGVDRWTYDTAPHGIGKIATVRGADGYAEDVTYDALGRPSSEIRGQLTDRLTLTTSYDQYSRPMTLTYPTGFAVKNIYNSSGYLAEVRRVSDNKKLWSAEVRNARGQLERQLYGNGIRTDNTYTAETGLVTQIKAGVVQDLRFSFDSLGNLVERSDARVGARESFAYDSLNRLIRSQVVSTTAPAVTLEYDALGNITYKSDTGSYTYGERGAGPHAVTSITGARANTYSYDLAGNRITSIDGAAFFDSNGVVTKVRKDSTELRFRIDPKGTRYIEETYVSGTLRERKVSIASMYERIETPAKISHLHYIQTPEGPIAIYKLEPSLQAADLQTAESGIAAQSLDDRVRTAVGLTPRKTATPILASAVSDLVAAGNDSPLIGQGTVKSVTLAAQGTMLYLHKDHLGSIQTITNDLGRIVEVMSFDSWGLRRDATSWLPASAPVQSKIDRGFTGHEHLDEVDLIHMNGRVYDPLIGRFITPDPVVQSSTDLQSFNRYSYVMNNPLSFTDPSGFRWRSFLKRLRNFLRTAITIAVTVAASYFTGGAITAALGHSFFATAISAAGSSIASSVAGSVLRGGSIMDGIRAGLRAAPMSALQGVIAFRVGDIGNSVERALVHGVTGGALSVMQGGKFAAGFFSSAISNIGGHGNMLQSVLLGGAASRLTGGKFEDGAMRATFIHLYNDLQHQGGDEDGPKARGQQGRAQINSSGNRSDPNAGVLWNDSYDRTFRDVSVGSFFGESADIRSSEFDIRCFANRMFSRFTDIAAGTAVESVVRGRPGFDWRVAGIVELYHLPEQLEACTTYSFPTNGWGYGR